MENGFSHLPLKYMALVKTSWVSSLRSPREIKFAILPRVGEFMVGLRSDFYRRMVLRTTFICNKDLITADYVENVTRAHKVEGSKEAMLKVLRRQFFGELSDEIRQLGEMDVPILLVWGRQDKGAPLSYGEEMHRILKGSRLEVLDRAGHCPQFEHPQEFNDMALDFLVGTR